jgi:ABC-type amino acid transport substrate-binding protein
MRRRTFINRLFALCILGACFLDGGCRSGQIGGSTQKPSVYDRVLQSGVIRASYAVYQPYCIKDPNTGKMSGLYVEVLEEAGRRLDLKVQWTEEVGWGAIFEGLNSDRHDIFGAGIWRNASRSKVGDFTHPLIYNVIKAWVRSDEKRLKGDLSQLNSPAVRISTLDGAIDDLIAKTDYPKAQRVSIPQLAPPTDLLLNVISKKADVSFSEPAVVNLFLEKNPGTLKELAPDKPVRVFANCFAFKLGEEKFKAMLNGALDEIANDGTLDRIIGKYERHPGEFYRLAKPYELPAR